VRVRTHGVFRDFRGFLETIFSHPKTFKTLKPPLRCSGLWAGTGTYNHLSASCNLQVCQLLLDSPAAPARAAHAHSRALKWAGDFLSFKETLNSLKEHKNHENPKTTSCALKWAGGGCSGLQG
jgi:hypothetical protein